MIEVFIVAIVFSSAITIVKMALKHSENIERIKHGYPLPSGERPLIAPDVPKIPELKEPDVIDYTSNRQQ